MSHGGYLKNLLAPLGVYRLEGTVNGAELESLGLFLDAVQEKLEDIHRQADLTTAGEEGLAKIEALFSRRPVAGDMEGLRTALAALLRVGGDSFTLAAINDNLAGCGINAVVSEELEPQSVTVRFPDVAGEPEGFAEMKAIIEEIIPCHLAIEYVFWYITWAEAEAKFPTWGDLESLGLTWDALERYVR